MSNYNTTDISKQVIKQRYYEIMDNIFNKYMEIDENDIECVGNKLIEELENRIITDNIINMYNDNLVKEELKIWREQTFEKMKSGIKHAKNDYDEKYNGMIKSMEIVIMRNIENIWKDISNKINDLYLSFDDICRGNIEKIKNELRNFNFHYRKYNFIKYECKDINVTDIPCAWLVYTKSTKETKDNKSVYSTFINEMKKEKDNMLEMYKAEYKKYYNQFTETRKENLAIYLTEPMYACTKLEETRKMVEIIRSKGYDVYFLDMLPTMKYINKMNTNIIEKYEFIVNKVRLYEIQTKEDFEKKYSKKIVTKYYSLNNYKNNEIIADIIKNKIIDKLFFYLV
jgi:hypothetical protein